MFQIARYLAVVVLLPLLITAGRAEDHRPQQLVSLIPTKGLSGLTTWLKDTKRDDPRKVFQVSDGVLHISGDGFGYVATEKAYRDYHLTVEFRWGKKTDGGKYVRNSGILLHSIGPDGGAGGTWMSSIECQLAQGCVGDLIPIRGKSDQPDKSAVIQFTSETELAPDGKRRRWKAGGEKVTYPPTRGQLWWSRHDWDFKELLDTRGRDDVESKVGEWTKVECLCDGNRITVKVNGTIVNQVTDVQPAAGKILLQSEGFELFVKTWTLAPLQK